MGSHWHRTENTITFFSETAPQLSTDDASADVTTTPSDSTAPPVEPQESALVRNESNEDESNAEKQQASPLYTDDPASWVITDDLLEYVVRRDTPQNIGDFSRSERIGKTQKRYLPLALFHRKMTNGQVVKRHWLSYSSTTGSVFCVPCKVFSQVKSGFTDGFSDWKHCHVRVSEHENSDYHKTAVTTWISRANSAGRIDREIVKQVDTERVYWRNVLQRVIETVKFIAERGLAYRGDDERFECATNGNFMGILELLAKFDPFLSQFVCLFVCLRGV